MKWAALCLALLLAACSEPYRVGEFVLVEWEEGKIYPAYIVDISGKARYRVHFDGYDSRWDEDVGIDRVKGRVEGPVVPPPPPAKVERASQTVKAASAAGPGANASPAPNPTPGVNPSPAPNPTPGANPSPAPNPSSASNPSPSVSASAGSSSALANPYQAGDRVRVSWRGSVYSATVLEIISKDRLLVHYEGHENAWDEVVHTDRIAGKKP